MTRSLCLYLHVHQPWRVRPYSIFEAGSQHNYFDQPPEAEYGNQAVLDKVAAKSYLPTNQRLLKLLEQHQDFKLSLSITGTLIEQLERWRPDVLDSFKQLVATGRVELVAETYHHSLAFFYDREEFAVQVAMQRQKLQDVFGVEPKAFRNTELAYTNELAQWAESAGFTTILAEGWDPILDWRSPNFVYRPAGTQNIRLLLKNYRLSDDIAFRFSDQNWSQWPLTASKFVRWLNAVPADQPLVNLFIDYETFGEHQWEDSGIFNFLQDMPKRFLAQPEHQFVTVSEAANLHEPADVIDMPNVVTWADSERDLSAWTGNAMQQQAIQAVYGLAGRVRQITDADIWNDWRKLQTSDHFYYMSTKWFSDGDIHAYFSPYESPYEAFISYLNVLRDLELRLSQAEGQS